jgi:hypothetical protein
LGDGAKRLHNAHRRAAIVSKTNAPSFMLTHIVEVAASAERVACGLKHNAPERLVGPERSYLLNERLQQGDAEGVFLRWTIEANIANAILLIQLRQNQLLRHLSLPLCSFLLSFNFPEFYSNSVQVSSRTFSRTRGKRPHIAALMRQSLLWLLAKPGSFPLS